jgi:ABC-type phosphate transport system substrate-binding protein
MHLAKARRLVAACVLPAAAVAVLAGPGAASASPFKPSPPAACEGESVKGQGSTLQEFAQHNVWIPDFNAFDCLVPPATEPVITYTGTGSGAALESWGAESATSNFGPTNAFVGTDNAPNQKQKEEIEEEEPVKTGEGKVETIPVEQAAVAIIVHLPGDCVAKAGKGSGKKARLAISNAFLERIFEGQAHWSEFSKTEDKDKLKCSGKTGKAAKASLIKRVVREDGSGTTAITMKYFGLSNGGKVIGGTTTWDEEAQLAHNTEWPNNSGENAVIKAKGSGGVVNAVAADEGTIGYVNLANARSKFGAGGQLFWLEVEHGAGSYADPSTDGLSTTTAKSNCEATNYTNGTKSFPPTSTEKTWNEVTTALVEPNYPICGLTYDLAVKKYNKYTGTNAKEARTVRDYFEYMLSTGPNGGQSKISANTDYEALPSIIEGIATEGAEGLTFE